jgi:flagellum-specific peptidoglycan hydrolase FlgJ
MKKVVLTIFLSLVVLSNTKTEYYEVHRRINILSENTLLFKMKQIGILYPEIVLAQAKIETGNFTSVIFIENNNLFGMKLPERRKTTAVGENRNHAKYTSWVQSLLDYKIWQDGMIHKTPTKRSYLSYLKRNYAEDKNYIKKIKQII